MAGTGKGSTSLNTWKQASNSTSGNSVVFTYLIDNTNGLIRRKIDQSVFLCLKGSKNVEVDFEVDAIAYCSGGVGGLWGWRR